ncbi:MAG: type II toxin-antitoxin system VapC family toxin [Chthoniobacterales bacterium]
MKQIVADASFCGAWVLTDESSGAAESLLARIISGSVQLVVPALWHYEMLNLLRSAVRRKRLATEDLDLTVESLERVPMTLEDLPGAPARRRILHLAMQFDLSSYDAAYLELADRFKISLQTNDAKLAAAAKQLRLPN